MLLISISFNEIQMNYMLLLTPAGHLILRESDNDAAAAPGRK